MEKKLTILLIINFIGSVFCQNYDGICFSTDKLTPSIENINYTFYKSETIINQRYNSIKEITNSTPELLLKSQYSVRNNNWLSKNYKTKQTWTKDQFSKFLKKGNYLELLFKINIDIENSKYCILKVNAKNKSSKKIFSYSLILKKYGNKWYIDNDDSLLSNISFVIMFLSVDDLYYILNKNKKSDNNIINEVKNKIYVNNTFSFNAFQQKLGSLLMTSKYKTKPYKTDIKFKQNTKGSLTSKSDIPYQEQSYCYFFDNKIGKVSTKDVISFFELIKKNNNYTTFKPKFLITYKNTSNKTIRIIRYESKTKGSNLKVFTEYYINNIKSLIIPDTNNQQLDFLNKTDQFIDNYFKEK